MNDRKFNASIIRTPGEECQPLTRETHAPGTQPSSFGRFRVVHQVGAGVLGPVFRAFDPDTGRTVALKSFPLDLTPEQAARLGEEFQRLSTLELAHPSLIVPIAAGAEGSTAYLVEEYFVADSVDTALRQYGPAPVGDGLRLVGQLAGALDFASAAGVHHGALHPRDILVAPRDVRMTGAGVAAALEAVGYRTPVRRPYSAPERADGREWGAAADIYSLAALAFELLTGRRPTAGAETVTVETDAIPSPEPAVLAEVFARAFSVRPEDRYPSALAFAGALKHALTGQPLAVETEAGKPKTRRAPRAARKPQILPLDGGEHQEAAGSRRLAADEQQAADSRQPTADSGSRLSREPDTDDRAPASEGEEAEREPLAEFTSEARQTTEPEPELTIAATREDLGLDDLDAEPRTVAMPRPEAPADEGLDLIVPEERAAEPLLLNDLDLPPRDEEPFELRAFELPGEQLAAGSRHLAADEQPTADSSQPTAEEQQAAGSRQQTADTGSRRSRGPETDDRPRLSGERATDVPGVEQAGPVVELGEPPDAGPVDDDERGHGPSWARRAALIVLMLVLVVALGYVILLRRATNGTPGAAAPTDVRQPLGGAQGKKPDEVSPERRADSAGQRPPAKAEAAKNAAPPPTIVTGPSTAAGTSAATPAGTGAASGASAAAPDVAKRGPEGSAPSSSNVRLKPDATKRADEVSPKHAPGASSSDRRTRAKADVTKRRAESAGQRPAKADAKAEGRVFEGSLSIVSRPSGARVFFDGHPVGTTPMALQKVSAGSHVVRLESDGYLVWSSGIQVAAGRQNAVKASLDRVPR